MMKYIFTALLLLVSSSAFAGGNKVDFSEELSFLNHAESSLDDCSESYGKSIPSKSDDSLSDWDFHRKRITAARKYKECTHYVYNSLIKRYYSKDAKAWKRISEKYNKGLEGVEDTASEIYFSSDYCAPGCGLMWEHEIYMNAAGYNQTMARNIIYYHRRLFD